MLFLLAEGGNRAVQDLDRPPLGHNRDGTSALANRNTRRATRSRCPPRSGRPRQHVAAAGFRTVAGTTARVPVTEPTGQSA
jgi:hypothetical protein